MAPYPTMNELLPIILLLSIFGAIGFFIALTQHISEGKISWIVYGGPFAFFVPGVLKASGWPYMIGLLACTSVAIYIFETQL